MIIDAMDLLYTGRFSGFCIVSSDSDFARLASRIREQGLTVYGFGERKTPRPFVTACDKFVYVDVLGITPVEEAQRVSDGKRSISKSDDGVLPIAPSSAKEPQATSDAAFGKLGQATLTMLAAAVSASADEDGRANLARVGSHLSKQAPDFDARNYGFARLSELAEASGSLEVERDGKVVNVRLAKR